MTTAAHQPTAIAPDDPGHAQATVDRARGMAFADPRVALVHVRAVEYGCFPYEVRGP